MAKAALKTTKTRDDDPWQWMQAVNDKDRWSTVRIPDGDIHAPYIKRMSKNSNGTWSFYVYRNMKCIGAEIHKDSDTGLKMAQARAKVGKPDPKHAKAEAIFQDFVKNKQRDAEAFALLTEGQRIAVADSYPWALPSARKMEEKGVKHVKTVRTDLMGKHEKAAAKSGKWDLDQKIKRIKDGNPKKEGSVQRMRWELVFGHDGKTLREFFAKGGDKYGLEGTLEFGYIKLV